MWLTIVLQLQSILWACSHQLMKVTHLHHNLPSHESLKQPYIITPDLTTILFITFTCSSCIICVSIFSFCVDSSYSIRTATSIPSPIFTNGGSEDLYATIYFCVVRIRSNFDRVFNYSSCCDINMFSSSRHNKREDNKFRNPFVKACSTNYSMIYKDDLRIRRRCAAIYHSEKTILPASLFEHEDFVSTSFGTHLPEVYVNMGCNSNHSKPLKRKYGGKKIIRFLTNEFIGSSALNEIDYSECGTDDSFIFGNGCPGRQRNASRLPEKRKLKRGRNNNKSDFKTDCVKNLSPVSVMIDMMNEKDVKKIRSTKNQQNFIVENKVMIPPLLTLLNATISSTKTSSYTDSKATTSRMRNVVQSGWKYEPYSVSSDGSVNESMTRRVSDVAEIEEGDDSMTVYQPKNNFALFCENVKRSVIIPMDGYEIGGGFEGRKDVIELLS